MIDVIVPVYNTPIEDMERCLNSIVCQHYRQWKVILIDDGSEKTLATWLDEHYGRDARFHIVHTPNHGVSSARNLGLSLSDGDFVAFCDSDDTMEPDYLAHASALMEQFNLDMVVGGCLKKTGKAVEMLCCTAPENGLWLYENERIYALMDYMLTGIHRSENAELGTVYLGSIYSKLYRRSILKNQQFDSNVRMSEDTLYNTEYMLQCRRIGIVPEVWYSYYSNDYSATHKPREVIAPQQFEFSKAIDKLRPRFCAAGLENVLNISLFWKMEYCLRTAYLRKKRHCIETMRDILEQEPFAEVEKLNIHGYLDLKRRNRIIFSLLRIPKGLRVWGFYAYYMAFYFVSGLLGMLRRAKSGDRQNTAL